ncbi:HAMP domain-containing histidine kinase [Mucilaginibacter sp. RB4R14]|uniref:sensor histidine kinase n=1 Tax=Mucilaginibacter aurantiaciroseus TaxID=2949308 RepID=UPI00209175C1|nr:HAMP domain-containing sensor histidine kinase [Mucilaginibacter aurantiaciroseus]MCO5934760.1 HAMP domain-containing histidine kinase [Mucilaginibacter aurantiaciroseus]
METHFFTKLSLKYSAAYRNYYTYQNLQGVRTASFIFLTLNIIIRILYHVFPESLTKAQNFPEFNLINWIFIIVTPFFYLISHLLAVNMRRTKHATAGMALFVFIFSLYIICCGMYSSFISTSDPSNALTLYLIALSIVSVLFVFEYYETIVLLIGIEMLFTMMLFHAQVSATEMTYNQMISAILLAGFYLTSRYFFSYKASYYGQIVEIRQKNEEINKANQFKNQVLGTVAHDLRNPIAAVESLAMMMELEDIDEDTQDSLNMMRQSCVKARTIIDDLLDAARNENLNSFETTRTEMNKCLQNIVNTWKVQIISGNKVVFTSDVKDIYAQISLEKFPRVIDNLISNALKFSKDTDNVELSLNRLKNNIVIKVKDRGMGIPKEMLPNLFERFSGAGRTGLKGEQSTGIGLSIVKDIVESHGGKIAVESVEGKGSTFTIMLPMVE